MKVVAALILGVFAAASGYAQDNQRVFITPRVGTPRSGLTPASLRVNVRMVLIPVTVTDAYGAPVAGVPKQSFHLFEDGVEQQIQTLSSEDAPISMGVVFDASRSMDDKMDQSRAAVSSFLRGSIPGDEYFLVAFNDAARILSPFTTNVSSIERSLVNIESRNWTALLDAVYLSIRQMHHAKNSRRALLIVSDGADNYSRYTEAEMKSAVREADVCIYSIALAGKNVLNRHVRLLRQLSNETGGLMVQVSKVTELQGAVEKISDAIRHQYLLGYVSNSNAATPYRKIQVKLEAAEGKPRTASWRNGYYVD